MSNNDNRAVTTKEPCGVAFEQLISTHSECDRTERLPTGFVDLDVVMGGLPADGLTVIAARPVMGHRELAQAMARNMALVFGIPTAYVSSVLSERDLAQRVLQTIVKEVGSKVEIDGVQHSTASLIVAKHPPLYFESANLYSTKRIEDLCLRLVETRGVRVIFLDSPEDLFPRGKMYDFYGLGKLLKSLALRLGVCIVAVTHVSRAAESRGGIKVPMLCDMRSGLELHADLVMFVYRAAYYGIKEDEMGPTKNLMQVFLHKDGYSGFDVRMFYDPVTATFGQRSMMDRAIMSESTTVENLREYRSAMRTFASDRCFIAGATPVE